MVFFQEFPNVWYLAAKSYSNTSTMPSPCDLLPNKLAVGVWNRLCKYRSTIPNFPQSETCEFLIVDRSIDQVKL